MSDEVNKAQQASAAAEKEPPVGAPEADSATSDATEPDGVETTEAGAEETGAAETGYEADGLNDVVAVLESQLNESKEQMLRLQAEMQNVHRRARNDVEKAHKFGVERFVKEMLPVVDSLEKAIEACETSEDSPAQVVSLKDGVELTLSMTLSALKKFEVEVLNPVGEAFNPQLHEAMSVLPRDDVEPNSVVAVLQKGYLLSGRVVRPAMVIVAKAP